VQKSMGATLNLNISLTGSWLALGPGWAALAGAMSGGLPDLNLPVFFEAGRAVAAGRSVVGNTVECGGAAGLWAQLTPSELPPPPRRGIWLPYASPLPGRTRVLAARRYRRWWQESIGLTAGHRVVTALGVAALALLLGASLNGALFWLALLAIVFTLLAGLGEVGDLTAPTAGDCRRWPLFSALGDGDGVVWPAGLVGLAAGLFVQCGLFGRIAHAGATSAGGMAVFWRATGGAPGAGGRASSAGGGAVGGVAGRAGLAENHHRFPGTGAGGHAALAAGRAAGDGDFAGERRLIMGWMGWLALAVGLVIIGLMVYWN
jgi:hypothetical protein